MQWGVAALGVLFLSSLVALIYYFFDIDPYFMYAPVDQLPHVMVTVLIVAVIGYVYENRRATKWYAQFERRLADLRGIN